MNGQERKKAAAPTDVKCEPVLSRGALPKARRSKQGGGGGGGGGGEKKTPELTGNEGGDGNEPRRSTVVRAMQDKNGRRIRTGSRFGSRG